MPSFGVYPQSGDIWIGDIDYSQYHVDWVENPSIQITLLPTQVIYVVELDGFIAAWSPFKVGLSEEELFARMESLWLNLVDE